MADFVGMNLDRAAFNGQEIELNSQKQSRYIQPPLIKRPTDKQLRYADAKKMAAEIELVPGFRGDALLSGSFIFGDFIESLIVDRLRAIKTLTISTLGMSQNNIDSLAGLLERGEVQRLNLIVSDFFYSHERFKLVPYIYEKLDIAEDAFQFAVTGTHCKVALLDTLHHHKIVIHGSANLRSSGNLEQLCIEENPALYDMHMIPTMEILANFATINQHVANPNQKITFLRRNELWQKVVMTAVEGAA